jgi:hypothetical protein
MLTGVLHQFGTAWDKSDADALSRDAFCVMLHSWSMQSQNNVIHVVA